MGILDELRREAANRLRAFHAEPSHEGSPLPVHMAKVIPLLEMMHSFLDHFSQECNLLDPDASASYCVASTQSLVDLQQRDYKVKWDDASRGCFTLTYLCVGEDPVTITVSSQSGRESIREHLNSHDLRYRVHELAKGQSAFTVQPRVPVTIRFEPHPDVAAVRMKTRNFDALGESHFRIDAELIDDTLVDELARRLVRKPSRFDELIGNRVPESVRVQLRNKVAARQRAREKLNEPRSRKRKAEEDKPPARGWKSGGKLDDTGRSGLSRPRAPHSPQRSAAIEAREGSTRAEPAPVRSFVREEPSEEAPALSESGIADQAQRKTRTPRYAWMVTGDMAAGTSSATVGRIGPPGVVGRFTLKDILTDGRQFRMRNQDGQVVYTGYITGKYNGFEPLADYGAARGCLFIEYEKNGRWGKPKVRKSSR